LSVAIAACIAALIVSALASGYHVRSLSADRAMDRTPVVATTNQPTDTFFLGRSEVIGTTEIQIVAFDPVDDAQKSTLPAGVATLPDPGTAVVSPALAETIASDPTIAGRFPQVANQMVAFEGLRDPGELIAYVRVPTPGTLTDNASAIRASAIGGDPNSYGSSLYLTPAVDGIAASLFAGLLFLIPAVLILRAGVAARSEVLEQRILTMTRLGASRSAITRLLAIDTAVPAAVGAIAGVIAAAIFTRFNLTLPFTGYRVSGADMNVGLRVHVLTVLAVAAAAVTSTLALTSLRRRHPRDAAQRSGVTLVKKIAGALSTSVGPLLMVSGSIVRGETGGNLFLIGLLCFFIGLPKLLTSLVTGLGQALASRRTIELHLAGARISDARQRTARLLISLVCLIVMVSIVQVFYTRFDPATSPIATSATAFDLFTADEFSAATAEQLLNIDGVRAVVLHGTEAVDEDPTTGMPIDNTAFTLICPTQSTCPTVSGDLTLSELFAGDVDNYVASNITPTIAQSLDTITNTDLSRNVRATMLIDADRADQAWAEIAGTFSAPYFITDDVYQVLPSPIIGWINLGLYSFVSLALLSIGLAYSAHVRTNSERNTGLVRLGMSHRRLQRTIAAEVAIPFTAATTIAALLSFATAYMYAYLDGLNAPTTSFMAGLTISSLGIGAVVTFASAIGGGRSADRLALRNE
jgi:hypothetical protein